MHLIKVLADILIDTILDPDVLEKARLRKGAFTRNSKKLPYLSFMKLMFRMPKQTISAALDSFFTEAAKSSGGDISDTTICTQQAFSKARAGISHAIFQECFERMLDFFCAEEALEYHKRLGGLWGIQAIAIDGSRIPLPNRKVLLYKYGSIGRGSSSPTANASVAFDVLNNRVLDAQLEPMSVDERTLAIRHMDNIKAKHRTNLLYTMFIFDRGYASENLMSYIENTIQAKFLFRLRRKFNNEIDALPIPNNHQDIIDQIVYINNSKIRILRFLLPGGCVETLATNAWGIDKECFRQLYFLRWPVEENYKLIKEKIGLVNFGGYSENSVLQEFWIAILMTNFALAVKQETDGIIDYSINRKNNRHVYQTNLNELVGCICRHIADYFDAECDGEKQKVLHYILNFGISHRVQNKKGTGQSFPRGTPRKVKHHYNVKITH